MQGDNLADLSAYAPKMLQAVRPIRIITDVNSDQQNHGLQAFVTYDRDEAARYGIAPSLIDSTLYDAYRTAAGLDDVSRPEPVPRRDGSGAGVLAER